MQAEHATSRLPLLNLSDLDDAQAALHAAIVGGPRASDGGKSPITDEQKRLLGPFNAMLFNPKVGEPMQALGAAIRYRTSLSDASREIAILTLAIMLDSEFEWFAHQPIARAAGVSEDTLAAIAANEEPSELASGELVVYRSTRSLIADGDLDDAQYSELVTELGTTASIELVALIGYYHLLALLLRTFRISPPGQ